MEHKQERWSLDDLFPAIDAPETQEAFDRLDAAAEAFEAFRPKLGPEMDAAAFVQALEAYEALARLVSRVGAYAQLKFSEDTQDQSVLPFLAKVQQKDAELENRTLFFKLWWKGLEDEPAARLMAESGDYRYWLEALRLQKPYTLSEPEEKIINLKDVNGPEALITLYDSITNRYVFKLQVNGEAKELNREQLTMYVRNPDPELRAGAYQELLRVYNQDASILGQIYQARVRDWYSEQVDLRGFSSPLAVRNLGNDIPDAVVETLLEVCRENVGIFQRYFQLKARWLGLERLRRYDVYAPVVKTEKTIEYKDAVDLVLESFRDFEPQVADLAQRVFDEHHIDSEVRNGKRSGAFCATAVPDLTPWVLMTYNGRPDDVATMAHELGHGVHSLLAAHHTHLTQHSSLPLAETASTFGEMLLIDRLLEQDPDPEVQRDLLFRQMDDSYATIVRQAYFAMFERTAHDRIHKGASVDELSGAYLENLKHQFGDALDLTEDFRDEWVAIPHFYHYPFYVYAYAFGQLLVLSLYEQYKQEGDAFKPRYLGILSAGGSASPEQVLEGAGIDMHSPAFWQGGFDVLTRALEELESIEIPKEMA